MTSSFDSVRSVMRGILVRGALITAAIAVLACGIGFALAGMPGVWSGLIGAAAAFCFFGITALLMYLTADSGSVVMAGAVLGGFLIKVVLFMALGAFLAGRDFYDPWVLFGTLAAAAIASLVVDIMTVQGARLPIVDER